MSGISVVDTYGELFEVSAGDCEARIWIYSQNRTSQFRGRLVKTIIDLMLAGF